MSLRESCFFRCVLSFLLVALVAGHVVGQQGNFAPIPTISTSPPANDSLPPVLQPHQVPARAQTEFAINGNPVVSQVNQNPDNLNAYEALAANWWQENSAVVPAQSPAQSPAQNRTPRTTAPNQPGQFQLPPSLQTPSQSAARIQARNQARNQTRSQAQRRATSRQQRAPAMFGDFYGGGLLPIERDRFKISENNRASPSDRIFFTYNHYEDTIADVLGGMPVINEDIDQFTVGFEKTFSCELWSFQLRMPFYADRTGLLSTSTPFDMDSVGNLGLALKRCLFRSECFSSVAGVGFNFPTGSDLTYGGPGGPVISNDAFHFLPFAGLLATPTDRSFYHAFIQFDLAADGYPDPAGQTPVITPANLLHLDVAAGYWFYRNPGASLTGIAALAELHCTSSLTPYEVFQLAPFERNFGVANFTVGLHLELADQTTIRFGGSFPLVTEAPLLGSPPRGPERGRFFESEVILQINRYF